MTVYGPYRDGNIFGVIAIDTNKAILHKSNFSYTPDIEIDGRIISGSELYYNPLGVFAFWFNDLELMTTYRASFYSF